MFEIVTDEAMDENLSDKNHILRLIELGEQLILLKDSAKQKLDVVVELSFEPCDKLKKLLESISMLRESTKFTSKINEVIFTSLL